MLVEFRVGNYRSFKDEQVFSLLATQDEVGTSKSVSVGNCDILKAAVIYGANASGKSNLIDAMRCMRGIVVDSAGYKPNDELPVVPFLFDDQNRTSPSVFEITFFIGEVRYQYSFSATQEKVHMESLLAWPKGRQQVWFIRNSDETEPYFGQLLKGQNKAIWEKVKQNSLFLSVAAQWNHEQLIPVYRWFEDHLKELPGTGMGVQLTDELFYDVEHSEDSGALESYRLAKEILRHADFGIEDISLERIDISDIKFPKDMPENVKKVIMEDWDTPPRYRKTFFHIDNKYSLPFEYESDGTQKFYALLGPILMSCANGYTIFEDELERSLHPLLTRKIVESALEIRSETACAQLIFTTHDTTLLDPELFGRGQVWFTEKDKDGATRLYSLADYKGIRKGEAMQKGYLAGRYGAIPILERFNLSGTKEQ